MSDEARRKKLPTHQALNQLFHSPDGRHPGTVNRFLVMHQVGGWLELNRAALAEKNNSSPTPSCADRGRTCIRMARTFDSTFNPAAQG